MGNGDVKDNMVVIDQIVRQQEEIEALKAELAAIKAQGEPVAVVDANDDGYWADILPDRSVKVGQKLYLYPAPSQPINGPSVVTTDIYDPLKPSQPINGPSVVTTDIYDPLKPSQPSEDARWQPISTAPKDGTRILLCIDHGKECDKIWTGLWANAWMVSYGKSLAEPTHWMPLPAAPAMQEGK